MLAGPAPGRPPRLPVVQLRFRPGRPVLQDPSDLDIADAFGLLDPAGPRRGLRPRRGRLRPGRAGRQRVRGVGGPAHAGAGAGGDRRAGGHQLADPQLPGLPDRDQRQPAGLQRLPAGLGVRQHVPLHACGPGGSPPRTACTGSTLSDGASVLAPDRRRRHGGELAAARRARARGAHRHAASSTGPRSARRRPCAAGTCSWSAAATPPGRPPSTSPGTPTRSPCWSAGPALADDHVGLPDPRAGGAPEHRHPAAGAGGGRRRRRLPGDAHRARPGHRRRDGGAGRAVRADRQRAPHRLARRHPGPGPVGLPPHRRRSSSRRRRLPALAAGPARPRCWRPACRACSPPATCGRARSSGSRRRWGRARWPSRWCTRTSPAARPDAAVPRQPRHPMELVTGSTEEDRGRAYQTGSNTLAGR